jgi:hypothetical protein
MGSQFWNMFMFFAQGKHLKSKPAKPAAPAEHSVEELKAAKS